MSEFPAFGKIPRLHRDVTITEKIDGTNGLVEIEAVPDHMEDGAGPIAISGRTYVRRDGQTLQVRAGSRSRWISPAEDNHGFAAWVSSNAQTLAETLGEGRHYGEWWGSGINRGYGLTKGEKRFSLFNVSRWGDVDLSAVPGLGVVPLLYEQSASYLNHAVDFALTELRENGSVAAPGFMRPEGIIVYHRAGNHLYKVTLEKDEAPKGKQVAA